MRHIPRTHRIGFDFVLERIKTDRSFFLKFVSASLQMADICAKGHFTNFVWNPLLHLVQIGEISFGVFEGHTNVPVADLLKSGGSNKNKSVKKRNKPLPMIALCKVVSSDYQSCDGNIHNQFIHNPSNACELFNESSMSSSIHNF